MRRLSTGLVGRVVLPAAPDDVGAAAGEDAFGVGMAVAGGAQLPVALLGPGFAGASDLRVGCGPGRGPWQAPGALCDAGGV